MNKLVLHIILLSAAAALAAQDSFFTDEGSADSFEFRGSVSSVTEAALDRDAVDEAGIHCYNSVYGSMTYRSEKVDIVLSLDMEDTGLSENSWAVRVAFDEVFGRYYFSRGDFELGLLKPVWGSGDGVHVLDILTPMNFSRFIEPDYADRKEPMPMAKFNLNLGTTSRLELVYLPYYEPDIYPAAGPWTQRRSRAMSAAAQSVLEVWTPLLYDAYVIALGGGQGLAAIQTMARMEEARNALVRTDDTRTPEYSQGALRYTMALRAFDVSLVAGTVFMTEPVVTGVDMSAADIITAPNPAVLDPHFELSYERAYIGGADAAGEAFGFGFRGEAAVRITRDMEGDDPHIPNSRLGWVAGLDRNFGFIDLYLNLQTQGEIILFQDGINGPWDTDYREDYTRNVIALQIDAKPLNDNFTLAVNGAYVAEDASFRVQPSLTHVFGDIFEVKAAYSMYEGDETSLFGQFDGNDYLSVTGTLSF
ncbi:MAG: hypothetical protein JXB03_04010 [Spirochaetales bacterium]|nr:hypothetical protein [Spirochaetales bacterium]